MHKGKVENLPVFDGVDAYYPLSAPYFRALFEHILYIGGCKALSVKALRFKKRCLLIAVFVSHYEQKKGSSNGL